MAIRPLNSVAGFSVGETPSNIILANGDITTTNITTTGVSNLNSVGNIKISGGSAGQVISTDGSGNLSFITIGTASLNNGTSNVTVLNSGNITFSVAGNANVGTFTSTGLNVDGYVTVSGNITGGNANLGNAATANFFIGSGSQLTNIAGANVTGTVANANNAAYAGNVTIAGQANITSLGTLTSLNVNAAVNAVSFSSNVATGTAPLTVLSNTLVANLNADLLDGFNTATANTANTVAVRDASGNLSANFFIGDGSQLTGIGDAASIANGTSNVRIPAINGNVNISAAGNANIVVVTGTGANIAGTANVTGNLSAGNISANIANLTTANVSGNVEATGVKTDNLYYANGNPWDLQQPAGANNQIQFNSNGSFGASANFAFDDATTTFTIGGANANIIVGNSVFGTNILSDFIQVGNLVGDDQAFIRNDIISITGNASTGNAYGYIDIDNGLGYSTDNIFTALNSLGLDIDNQTSNARARIFANGAIAATNSNDTYFAADGNAIQWLTSTNAGFLANANVATHTSKFQAPQLISNVATGTAPFIVTSTTQVANLNVATAGTAGSATTAGTVTTNAQPNITSVGTLSNLTVTGNVTSGNLNTLGNVNASIIVDGGTGIYLAAGPAGYINFFTTGGDKATITDAGNIVASNLVANSTVFAVAANVSGNVTAGNVYANSGTIGASLLTGTLTTAAQPNITSVGTLTSLTVTGTATAGNLSTGGTLSVTGNANVGNLGTGGLITATGNVSGGNLTTGGVVAATGNVSGGNLTTGGAVAATGNVSGGNLTTAGVLTVTGTGVSSIAGNLDMTSNTIINLATPTNPNDAATKQYVDDIAQGLHTHDSCNAATQTTLATISGGTITYDNGTSGVGATLTTTGTFTTIDGVTLSNGMRILVKNETNAAHNGIYDRTSTTVLTRSSDFDTSTEMAGGDFTFVTAGTEYDNTGWVMTEPVTTVGITNVVWVQFSGAGTYTAGTGLVLNGSVFSIANTTVTSGSYGNGDRVATFTVNAQGQLTAAANVAITANAANLTGTTLNSSIVTSSLTSVGTLGALAVTANVTAGNVYANTGTIGAGTLKGEGGNISNIQGANVSGAVSFATTANAVAGANVSGQVGNALVAGTVYTNAQPNITSVGTLSALSVTGNVSTGNISGTNGNLTTANISGNIILGNATVTTQITWSSLTTTSTAANQTIASISTTGVTGVEYLIKAIDSTGSKYSVASVIAVTDGTSVDYSTYGTVQLGGYTGSLVVNIVGGQVRLQVTPASSNSTVWTTQYRLI